MKKKAVKRFAHGCPVKAMPDCFFWDGLPRDPESLGMTPQQIEAAGITPNQRLYWCSECYSLWYESGNNFARRIGKSESGSAGDFTPTDKKWDDYYLGSK